MWPRDVNDVMHRKRAQKILGIWEKWVEWSFSVWRRRLTFRACRGLAAGAARGGGGGGGQMEKSALKDCVSLPSCQKTF